MSAVGKVCRYEIKQGRMAAWYIAGAVSGNAPNRYRDVAGTSRSRGLVVVVGASMEVA